MGKIQQFGLLLWKNYVLQKRKVLVTVLEIGLPTLFALILIFIRQRVISNEVTYATNWSSFDVNYLPSNLSSLEGIPGGPWRLAYVPNNTITRRVMDSVKTKFMKGNFTDMVGFSSEEDAVSFLLSEEKDQPKPFLDMVGFSSEEDAVSFLLSKEKDQPKPFLGMVAFENVSFSNHGNKSKLAKDISFKIRLSNKPKNAGNQKFRVNPFSMDTSWSTEFQFPLFQRVGPREKSKKWGGAPGYMREGFLPIQHGVTKAVIEELTGGKDTSSISLKLKRFPYPPYNDDPFVLVTQQQFPLILMLSFVFSALNIVKDVVHEKERKLKESMKMMGLNNWLHWLAWFVKYLLFLLISVAIMTLFFCIPTGVNGRVIGYTSPAVLLIFLMSYAMSSITFSFAVSVFFSKANSAAAAGGILFFCSYIPYFFLQNRYDTLTWGAKIGACLISNVAMAFGGQVIGMFEGTGAGVQFSNINQGVSVDDNFTMLHVILMLLLDTVLYAIVAWYVEAVWPGDYGVPFPWYFPVLKSYWCGTSAKETDEDEETTPLLGANKGTGQNSEFFEREPTGLKAGIQIKNLRKVFGRGVKEKVAVEGMHLNMYEGQITALLGHNGAGKTTTMSMLTGFIPPTSGTAVVNGFDIKQDIAGVRQSLGLCPQHDVLFDTLTVEEHLVFFTKLKGFPSERVGEEVDRMLTEIGLSNKRNALAKTLSGGMKRKLSVGIALIGGSKVIILDEPTSGMDPDARRHTWDLLQHYRNRHTMVLTTHFMDEADLLGDRIAIMASGVVQCCGSSLFLKNKYGAGYHMVIVKEPGCDVDRITNVIQSYIPTAEMESNIGAELAYILPQESAEMFERLFTELETTKAELKISSYGASVTTMEEVFLRVGESNDRSGTLRERLQQSGVDPTSFSTSYSDIEPPSVNGAVTEDRPSQTPHFASTTVIMTCTKRNLGAVLYLQQFWAMFVKRVLHTFRNWLITITQLAVPLFFLIMALVVLKTLPGPHDSPPLLLKLEQFSDSVVAYNISGSKGVSSELGRIYSHLFDPSNTDTVLVNNLTLFREDPDLEKFLVNEGVQSKARYINHYIIASSFNDTSTNKTEAVGHFNNQAYHTPGVTLAALGEAVLKYFTNDTYSLQVTNHPLPRTFDDKVNDEFTKETVGFSIAFNVLFGLAFLASSFVLFLIKERTVKAKHCQFVSGVHSFTFWSSTFCWDLINFMIPCVCILICFVAFNIEAYNDPTRRGYLMLLFLLYGWATLPFMYLLSFIFAVPSSGFVWLTMFNILSGIATILAVGILGIPELGTQDISKALEWVFLVFLPNFCLGQAFEDFYSNYQFLQTCNTDFVQKFVCPGVIEMNMTLSCCKGHCGDNCADFQTNYLAWEKNGIGRMLVFLAIQGLMYFLLLFLLESGSLRRCWYKITMTKQKKPTRVSLSRQNSHIAVEEDSDVFTERQRILSNNVNDSLVLKDLTKYYGNLLAVDKLSIGIPQGECFGLLGLNGAGKTTTFKMLTGDETVSSGNAFVDGFDLMDNIKTIQQRLGYCPQFDALIDQLTGRETLHMYAQLRGVPSIQIPTIAHDLIQALLLEEYADNLVGSYSGGNKRKLSTAIALVGDPPIIFLDEPTTGMDPVARRLLWDTLSRVRASGRTLILTSHSMEECEALCTRIAIMVNGQFKCLGSPQHLKNKFGEGYTLLAKVGPLEGGGEPRVEKLMDFITTSFPGSVLKDVHQGMVNYHIRDTSISWAKIFGTMERAKHTYNIEDYSVSQTTLEQVFINFARSQIPPQETKEGCLGRCGSAFGLCCCCCVGCPSREQELVDVVEQ